MKYSISEIAALYGISVRTLHYYDEIGLVPPSEVTEAGYRYYDDAAVAALQQVLFYRELQFSLREIAGILRHPQYDRGAALQHQKELLLLKRQHLDELLALLEETIGGTTMKETKHTTLEEIEAVKQQYAAETRRRWGDTEAFRESEEKAKTRTKETTREAAADADDIFAGFAALRETAPEDRSVQALVQRWQEHITRYYYRCTKEILRGLGEMYVGDERFTQNIDRFGDGTAKLMSEAIRIYCA